MSSTILLDFVINWIVPITAGLVMIGVSTLIVVIIGAGIYQLLRGK